MPSQRPCAVSCSRTTATTLAFALLGPASPAFAAPGRTQAEGAPPVQRAEAPAAQASDEEADATSPEAADPSQDPYGIDQLYEGPTPVAPAPDAVLPAGAEVRGVEGPTQAEDSSLLARQSVDMVPLNQALAPPDGKKMMIAGGVVYGLGFLGQLAGWRTIRQACETLPSQAVQDGDFGQAVSCGAGFAGGGLLLFFSAIPEFVGAPWIIAGASFHGRHRAFDDHFFRGYGQSSGKDTKPFVWAGAGLIAAGALSWIVSPIVAVRSCVDNPRLTCSVDATTWGFNLGLAAMTAGGSMLGYGIAYRRGFGRYKMLTPVSVVPSFGRGRAGLNLQGRF